MSFSNSIKTFCLNNPANTYWIAYSGGMDSHVLLSLMASMRDMLSINLRAIHVHHGLSSNADTWALHCEKICKQLTVDCITRKISLNSNEGKSLEEAARNARYAVFANYIQAGDILLTAHHQDDQAETFLLQLLRGAGVKGLSAMPTVKSFSQGLQARPLLSFARDELLQYANEQKLNWITDESNENKKFMRNFIRHELFPILHNCQSSAAALITRSAKHCAEAQLLLTEFAEHDVKNCLGSQSNILSVKKLLEKTPARQRLLLRHWIESNHFRMPDHRRLESILTDVLTAGWDREPCVTWAGCELRRHRDDLFLMQPLSALNNQFAVVWDMQSPLAVPGVGTLYAEIATGIGLKASINAVTIKLRTGGEVLTMPGRGNKYLKKLLQEWHVPSWQRDRIPLLYFNDKLIGIVGYFLHPDYLAAEAEMGWQIIKMNNQSE